MFFKKHCDNCTENAQTVAELRFIMKEALIPRHSFLLLMVSLFLLLIIFPLFNQTIYGKLIFKILFSLLSFLSLYAVSSKKILFFIGIALLIPFIFFEWITVFFDFHLFELLFHVFSLSFFIFVIAALLRKVFFHARITLDLVFGAVCIYVLIGIAFSQVYAAVNWAVPFSFHENVDQAMIFHDMISETEKFIYFSFVTLTTLGFGDISPVSTPARFFSIIEALIGQLYIATSITRVVSLYINKNAMLTEKNGKK